MDLLVIALVVLFVIGFVSALGIGNTIIFILIGYTMVAYGAPLLLDYSEANNWSDGATSIAVLIAILSYFGAIGQTMRDRNLVRMINKQR